MARQPKRICVYAGSSQGVDAHWHEAARELGARIARRGLDLVYGGGRVGLMGSLADAALAEGGRVYGVIPRKLQELEVGHEGCTELFVVQGMHSRKALMASLGDGFIALPGGLGTLEELFEMATWVQVGYQDKPVGLLNVAGYYDPLLTFLDRAQEHGFVTPRHRDLVQADADPARLLEALLEAPPTPPRTPQD